MGRTFGPDVRSSRWCPVRRQQRPPVITDAEPSLAEEQRRRKRRYVAIMVCPILLLVAAGVLFLSHEVWWALVAMVLAAPLPTVAVLVTNAGTADRTRRRFARQQRDQQSPGDR